VSRTRESAQGKEVCIFPARLTGRCRFTPVRVTPALLLLSWQSGRPGARPGTSPFTRKRKRCFGTDFAKARVAWYLPGARLAARGLGTFFAAKPAPCNETGLQLR
jgi:hypothetical protein